MRFAAGLVLAIALGGCADAVSSAGVTGCGTPAATADCLQPTHDADWYVTQAMRYFDTLDADAPTDSIPVYAEDVIRWEWPPWLKLTGVGRTIMIGSDLLIARFATPSTVPTRDCRFFETQPFARCRVSFAYEGDPCPIYEEFAFNDAGEITFIEAWSDLPGLLPGDARTDPWMEGPHIRRLSTKVPGLGYGAGTFDPEDAAFVAAASRDPDLEDLRRRLLDFWLTWADEPARTAGNLSEEAIYAEGCGWD